MCFLDTILQDDDNSELISKCQILLVNCALILFCLPPANKKEKEEKNGSTESENDM